MKELISVIIPVYKVEKYLDRCIDSVLHQTYKNLEIILVDDGSPDNCGKMCDEYAKYDKRIKVIHKKNGGLSDARNVGIDKAKGKYITFIDSDDWIPLNSIELLYKGISVNNDDISSGNLKEVFKYVNEDENYSEKNFEVYNAEGALKELMYLHGFSNSASGKLYKTKLFDNIRYPIGKYYEDLATTYKIFANSSKIVAIDAVVYYYFQNNNSIMHKKYTSKRLEGIEFAKEELKFIKENFSNITNAAIYRLCYECMSVLNDMPNNSKDKKEIIIILKKYRKNIIDDKNLSLKQRFLCYSTLLGQKGIKIAYKIRYFLKRR